MLCRRSLIFVALVLGACGREPTGPTDEARDAPEAAQATEPGVGVSIVATGLADPLFLTSPPGDPSRLLVVEREGVIRVIREGRLLRRPFLNLSGRVTTADQGGLFSMAFHPNYPSDRRFYVYFTNNQGKLQLREYEVGSNPNRALRSSGRTILTIPKPAGNHYGGLVAFGPDGYLHLAVGDGGSAALQVDNAQDKGTLLGKLLRIDIDTGDRYGIPFDNPFRGKAGRDEIWALGLRNPWRYAFDHATGDLYIADVGQDQWEEANVVAAGAAGLNYGWRIMEGNSCFDPPTGCDTSGLTLPVFQYDHSQGCSITGGYVYRGALMPSFDGVYFYSDFCSGFLRSFRVSAGMATEHRDWQVGSLGRVLSFGEDAAGELYVLSSNGTVYRLIETQ